ADYNDAQNFLFLLESRTGAMNYGRYSNPEFDSLIDRSNRELDEGLRARLMVQAEEIMLADMPILPVWHSSSRNLVDPSLTGWVDNVSDRHPSRFLCRPGAQPAAAAD